MNLWCSESNRFGGQIKDIVYSQILGMCHMVCNLVKGGCGNRVGEISGKKNRIFGNCLLWLPELLFYAVEKYRAEKRPPKMLKKN